MSNQAIYSARNYSYLRGFWNVHLHTKQISESVKQSFSSKDIEFIETIGMPQDPFLENTTKITFRTFEQQFHSIVFEQRRYLPIGRLVLPNGWSYGVIAVDSETHRIFILSIDLDTGKALTSQKITLMNTSLINLVYFLTLYKVFFPSLQNLINKRNEASAINALSDGKEVDAFLEGLQHETDNIVKVLSDEFQSIDADAVSEERNYWPEFLLQYTYL